jgi:hypothetical protein
MKKREIIPFGAAMAACLFAISCATPPKAPAPPESPAAAQSAQASSASAAKADSGIPAPDELRAEASSLRKKAFDLGMKEVVQEDYASAESSYAAGGEKYGTDNAASAASYSEAVTKFKAVMEKGLPLLADSERKRAEALKEKSIAARSRELFPRPFAFAEAELEKPRAAETGGDYETAVALFRASAKEYAVLVKLCAAYDARDYLASRDLAKWDASDWNLAETRYQASQAAFEGDIAASAASVDEALLRYGLARSAALEYYSGDRQKASDAERARAAGIKSEVAVKDDFAAAQELYAKAEEAKSAKDYESSSALYDRSASAFASAYSKAKVKMDGAKGELESLDAAIAAKNAEIGSR